MSWNPEQSMTTSQDFTQSLAQGIPGYRGLTPVASPAPVYGATPGVPGTDYYKQRPLEGVEQFSLGAQGLMGLMGAYNGYKQVGLMEDQLNMQKSLANRNIANSAATTNRALDDRASMAAQMTTGAEYGTQAYKDAKAGLQTTVDGSPVA